MAAVPTAMPMLTRFAALLREQHHPGITPVVLSMSSAEIESGLEDLSLDLALGYSARMPPRGPRLQSWPQYEEHYYLLCRECREYRDGQGEGRPFAFGADIAWREVAAMPLCLLTPDMHNRTVIDEAFAAVDMAVQPAMETNRADPGDGRAQGTDGMTTVYPAPWWPRCATHAGPGGPVAALARTGHPYRLHGPAGRGAHARAAGGAATAGRRRMACAACGMRGRWKNQAGCAAGLPAQSLAWRSARHSVRRAPRRA
ncbi:Centrosome-associated protein CEP250 [Manis javanica]|nr:Centrosome-associated protein CEP250 [Manis javanica]